MFFVCVCWYMNLCKHAVQTQKDVAYRVRRAAMHVVMGEDSQKRIHSHYMVSKCIYLHVYVCVLAGIAFYSG